ncbi:GTPase Era [Prochlorococcus sp. MIT 1300]|uniref:GTPase Era n=1 Tax=Prochlorococcus sp. MIT 1300 TaxID=3096218 RepID=UPI002A760FB5|nr:GTPase Era [Prochlorococcus sp. MIT 1300]
MTLKEFPARSFRSGFVAFVGRPNVGKSTLVNQLVGQKVAITSPVAQTTRNRLRAILTTPDAQLVILDTPGIHKPHHLLGERLVQSARSSIGEVDVVLLMFEGFKLPGKGDEFIVRLLQNQKVPVVVALNKWDLASRANQDNIEDSYQKLLSNSDWPIYRCSATTGDGCDSLIAELVNYLPLGPQLYPSEMVCDQPERVLLADLIREQVLLHTREEIPHSVAVRIERIEEMSPGKEASSKAPSTAILATVFVERKSQKGILIGKGGAMLKTIGHGARLQMQKLIDGPVYLELFVKVVIDWRSKPSRLNELGYEGN